MPVAPRGLRITPQTKLIEHAFQDDGNFLNRCIRSLDRIEVEDQVIRIVQMLNARHPRILLDVAGVCDVQKLITIRTDEIPDVALHVLRPELLSTYPAGRVVRRVLLIKRVAVNPVWKTSKTSGLSMRCGIRKGEILS